MATAKKSTDTKKRSAVKKSQEATETESANLDFSADTESKAFSPGSRLKFPLFSLSPKTIFILLIIVALAALVYYKKSWFIAATVNNMPVSNFEVLKRMNQQYRSQTLNQIINEKVLLTEATKKGVRVTSEETDNKIKEIEGNVGGSQTLDSLLAQQNQTRDDLKNQVRYQLMIEKLYQQEAAVTDEEINEFISQNQAQMTATDSAGQKKEAEQILKQQKLSQIFNQKFQELRQSANPQIY